MPSKRSSDERRAIVDLCTLEAVSVDWESAKALANRAGITHREASLAAVRLANAGVIEQRISSWRAARCRTRKRSEYRLPYLDNGNATAQWRLFPAWLLPPLQAEPNPQSIRRIRGRHTDISEDSLMISDIELNEYPRGVRKRFRDLKDADFAAYPEVIAAKERLDEHQKLHAENVERVIALRDRIAQLQQKQRDAREQLRTIADNRQRLIAEALLAGDDLSADQDVRERCATLEHFIEAVDIGLPLIRRKFDQAMGATQQSATSEEADKEHLRGLLDGLKLAEAQRLYNN